jgi:hypothetical protein
MREGEEEVIAIKYIVTRALCMKGIERVQYVYATLYIRQTFQCANGIRLSIWLFFLNACYLSNRLGFTTVYSCASSGLKMQEHLHFCYCKRDLFKIQCLITCSRRRVTVRASFPTLIHGHLIKVYKPSMPNRKSGRDWESNPGLHAAVLPTAHASTTTSYLSGLFGHEKNIFFQIPFTNSSGFLGLPSLGTIINSFQSSLQRV